MKLYKPLLSRHSLRSFSLTFSFLSLLGQPSYSTQQRQLICKQSSRSQDNGRHESYVGQFIYPCCPLDFSTSGARPVSNMIWKSVLTLLIGLYGSMVVICYRSTRNEALFPDLYEASISELQDGLQIGLFTSVDLVKVCPSSNEN